jgi:Amt family ammonium transporter
MKKLLASLALGLGLLIGGTAVMAQAPGRAAASAPPPQKPPADAAAPAAAAPAAAPAPAAAAAPAPKVDKGDTAWMLTSTLLVILMTIPGLALFYGGLAAPRTCCPC